MKSTLMRKAAELKSALVSKEAANNSTEVVILILFVVVIVFAVGAAVKALIIDGDSSVMGKTSAKVNEKITAELA